MTPVFVRNVSGVLGAAGIALCVGGARAADWPQWRGPMRNGTTAEAPGTWPAGGPRQLWTARVGEGYAAVAVQGNRVFTLGNDGSKDHVYCLDANTGRVVWDYFYNQAPGDYGGSRATPVLDGGNVYTLSRSGIALCLNAATGKLVWWKDLAKTVGAEEPRWGFGGSPLVVGTRVLYNIGSAGTAVDKATGKVLWKSGRGAAGYASPVTFRAGGQSGAAIFSGAALVAVDPASGRVLWQHPWQTQYDVNAADPVFVGDQVFISSNYNRGAALLQLSGGRPSVVWENRNMRNHFNSSVVAGGFLYGNDEGRLKCLDLRTGAERWQSRGLGKGGLILAGGKLVVLTERGEVQVAPASPGGFNIEARAQLPRGDWWTHPVLANGRLYCRSHDGVLVALDARAK